MGRVVSIGSLLGINAILRRGLEEADYAAFALAAATAIFLGLPAALGLPKVLLRVLREPRTIADPATLRSSLTNAGLLAPLGCVVCGLLVGALAVWTPDSAKWYAVQHHPVLVSLWMSGLALTLLMSHALQGFDRFFAASIIGARSGGVLANLVALVVCGGLWVSGRLTLEIVLVVQAAANWMSVALGVWVVRRQMQRVIAGAVAGLPVESAADDGPLNVSKRWFLAESLPNLLVQVTTTGIAQIEILIMGAYADEENIADYYIVSKLMELLVASHSLATTIVMPFIAELYARKETGRLEALLRGAASLVAVPTTVLAVTFLAFPGTVMSCFGEYGDRAVVALRIATVAAAISSYAGANALTMVMTGRQRTLLRASIIASACYLVAAPPLIIWAGATGAAAATLIVFGTYNIVITLLVRRHVGVWTIPTLNPQMWKAVLAIVRGRMGRSGKPAVNATPKP